MSLCRRVALAATPKLATNPSLTPTGTQALPGPSPMPPQALSTNPQKTGLINKYVLAWLLVAKRGLMLSLRRSIVKEKET